MQTPLSPTTDSDPVGLSENLDVTVMQIVFQKQKPMKKIKNILNRNLKVNAGIRSKNAISNVV